MKHLVPYLILVCFLLTSCAGMPGSVDINGLATSATDRVAAWDSINQSENEARVAIAVAERAKADADRAEAETEKARIESRPVISYHISDPLTLAIHLLEKANERLADSNVLLADSNILLGKVALAAVTGKNPSIYGGVPHTSFPGGAIAEGFKAFWGGLAEVANTPSAIVASGAWGLSQVLKNTPTAGTYFNGAVNADGSFNNQAISQVESSGSISAAPAALKPEVVYPEIVHPEIVHPEMIEQP